MRRLVDRVLSLLRVGRRIETHTPVRLRERCDHVILLDGTMSTLEPGQETNIGQIYKLLKDLPAASHLSIYYEAGVQWTRWGEVSDVALGRGINRQIRRAYGYLASRYHPGDRIFLMGFSRGAYAVRSLAGVIDSVGLLRADCATERNVSLAYRHYQLKPGSPAAKAFTTAFCHPQVEIEMIGVFDTVKALGMRLPLLWTLTEDKHAFHNHHLGSVTRHGFHALALDETRAVYEPVLWNCATPESCRVVQMWFRGTHSDIGGHINYAEAARPLANIPMVWMLECMETCGIKLPDGWHDRFPVDPAAPSVGTWRSWGKLFVLRRRRHPGMDPSEAVHPTAMTSPRAAALVARAAAAPDQTRSPGVDRPMREDGEFRSRQSSDRVADAASGRKGSETGLGPTVVSGRP